MSSSSYPMVLSERPPICNLVPPGQCQFNPTFQSVPLLDRIPCGDGGTSFILRFGLPDPTRSMNLPTCACILASADLLDNTKEEKDAEKAMTTVVRPYTPISTNEQIGSFDLLIKDYGANGFLSKYMCEQLKVGETINFKHIDFNIKIPAPFKHKKIGMIAGGTGITPMIQALHAILGKGKDDQKSATEKVTLLYGSRESKDILGEQMIEGWAKEQPTKFENINVLSNEPLDSKYEGERGFIDKEKILKYMPPACEGDDVIILVCGPPIMYELLCGPRDEKKVTGVLGELGYASSQVFKF